MEWQFTLHDSRANMVGSACFPRRKNCFNLRNNNVELLRGE